MKPLYFFLAFYISTFCSLAQEVSDSVRRAYSLTMALSKYKNTMQENLPLYTGKVYTNIFKGVNGDPFFGTKGFENGDVFFMNQLFTDVPVLYDIYSDIPIIQHYNKNVNIQLLKEKVDYFNLPAHHFVRIHELNEDSIDVTNFYEQVYESPSVRVLIRYTKNLQESSNSSIKVFQERKKYFIELNGSLHRVTGAASARAIFPGYKRQIKSELSSKPKIKFKREPIKYLIEVSNIYNKISGR